MYLGVQRGREPRQIGEIPVVFTLVSLVSLVAFFIWLFLALEPRTA